MKKLAAVSGKTVPVGARRRLIDIPVTKENTVLDFQTTGKMPTAQEVLDILSTACAGFQQASLFTIVRKRPESGAPSECGAQQRRQRAP